jgi:hypothetical protein
MTDENKLRPYWTRVWALVAVVYVGCTLGLVCVAGPYFRPRMLVPVVPPALVFMAAVVPGANVLLLVTAVLSVLFVLKRWPMWTCALLGACYAGIAYWVARGLRS